MTVREMYSVDGSPDLIGRSTDDVTTEVTAWQVHPQETMYPVVFLDALRVKIREDAVLRCQAVYLLLGVLPDDSRDILGSWTERVKPDTWGEHLSDGGHEVSRRGLDDSSKRSKRSCMPVSSSW